MTVQISSSRQASSKRSIEFTAGELEPVQHQEADTWPSDCAKVPGRSPEAISCVLYCRGERDQKFFLRSLLLLRTHALEQCVLPKPGSSEALALALREATCVADVT